jgi:hypothetical protein
LLLGAWAVVVLAGGGLLFELRDERPWLIATAAAGLALVALALFGAWALARKGPLAPARFEGLALLVIALAVGLVVVEFSLRLALPLLPSAVRDYASEAAADAARMAMRETLGESPFFKFKADAVVRSMGERGTDFVYTWRTDRLGFKNSPSALDGPVVAVALGDSFTEGMGVSIEDTWPARLGGLGLPTYNLGVQGYSPTQMLGTLMRYGLPLKPRVCLIGYTGTIFSREAQYLNQAGDLAGDLRARHEIKRLNRLVLLALARAAQQTWRARRESPPSPEPVAFAPMARWAAEFSLTQGSSRARAITRERIAADPAWKAALARLAEMDRACRERNARTLLLYFPHRPSVYFAKATGKPLPGDSFERVESSLMGEFAARHGMAYLDLSPVLERHVAALAESTPLRDYPFLIHDGHPSVTGHAVIADAVADRMRALLALP